MATPNNGGISMNDSSLPLSTMFCSLSASLLITIIMLATAIRVVPEFKRLSVFRLGRYIGEKGPGIVFLIPIIDKAVSIDTHDQIKKIQEQQNLWGAIGNTLTPVHIDGSVEISGQRWNAISKAPILSGTKVRVKKVILEIEKL